MSDIGTYLDQIGSVVAMGGSAGVGFYAIRWFFEWMAGRMDRREQVVDDANKRLIDNLEARLNAVSKRLDVVEKELQECNMKHARAEAEVLALRAIIQSKGVINQKAAQIVAADRLGIGIETGQSE